LCLLRTWRRSGTKPKLFALHGQKAEHRKLNVCPTHAKLMPKRSQGVPLNLNPTTGNATIMSSKAGQ
jgi:hypothetical protein